MKRREFITLLGGTAAWPLATRAQERDRIRRVGILLPAAVDDLDYQGWVGAFLQALALLGWSLGRNLRIDTRWAIPNPALLRKHAAELAASAPDVVLAHGVSGTTAMIQATRTIPIVFPVVGDPVGAGLVDSLARPGGNITGFMTFEYNIGGKWLELLKQIMPDLKRAAVLRDPGLATGIAHFSVIQAMAPSLGIEVFPFNLRDTAEIERSLTAFARPPNGGAIVTPSGSSSIHRDLILEVAARYKMPAVWFERNFVTAGGLISYGPDFSDQFRRAASYVDRILKGEKPAELTVQAPTKFEMVINLKTARALGLTVPPSVIARADEVIE